MSLVCFEFGREVLRGLGPAERWDWPNVLRFTADLEAMAFGLEFLLFLLQGQHVLAVKKAIEVTERREGVPVRGEGGTEIFDGRGRDAPAHAFIRRRWFDHPGESVFENRPLVVPMEKAEERGDMGLEAVTLGRGLGEPFHDGGVAARFETAKDFGLLVGGELGEFGIGSCFVEHSLVRISGGQN